MKRIFEWWYSYHMIVQLVKSVRSFIKTAKYNPELNLAAVKRRYDWAANTYNYVDIPKPLWWLVDWQFKRARKAIDAFDFTGRNESDGYTKAMLFYNEADHNMGHPDMVAAMEKSHGTETQYTKEHAGIMGYPEEKSTDG